MSVIMSRYMNYSSGSGGSQEPSVPDTPQPTMCTVTITGTGDSLTSTSAADCYVEINGVKYVSATTLQVESGTVMKCYVYAASYDITLNSASVGTGSYGTKEYNYTINEDCTVNLSCDTSINSVANISINTTSGSSANLITFTIEGTSYQSVPGMTWEEWVQSTYNTDNLWRVDQGNLVLRDGPYTGTFYIVQLSSEDVSPSDEIVSGRSYTTQFG